MSIFQDVKLVKGWDIIDIRRWSDFLNLILVSKAF